MAKSLVTTIGSPEFYRFQNEYGDLVDYGKLPDYGGKSSNRMLLSRLLSLDGLTVADYDASLGITGALNASAWANQIGIAGPLLQATGANQPIVLPYTGEKYAYLPGVAGNYLSTPNAAANQITGDIDIRVKYQGLYDPISQQMLVAKQLGSGNRSWNFTHLTTGAGALQLTWSYDGSTQLSAPSTASNLTSVLADNTKAWLRVTLDVDNGAGGNDVKFYTSIDDGVSWQQFGATVTTAGVTSIFGGTVAVEVGSYFSGSTPVTGKIYRAQIYNGIDGTLAVDFNAADWSETSTNGATATSSTTGEVWTLNNTGAKKAQIIASAQMLFDGTAHFLKAAPFTFNQPETIYLVGKQVTWTLYDRIFDGNTDNSGTMYQADTTPSVKVYAGASFSNSNFALNTLGVVTTVFNGASSATKVNGTAAVSGNGGASNMGGFTLGALGSGLSNYGNFQVKRVILRAAADSAATQAQIQSLLKSIYGTP